MQTGIRKRSLLLFIAISLCLGATSVRSQSVLNLPRIAEQTGRFTGIAVANPSNRVVSVTMEVFGETGEAVSFANTSKSASFKIGPGGQLARFQDQLFPLPPNFNGWARITSPDNLNLRGFYMIGDDAVTVLDGTNGAQAYREQVLPFLAHSDSIETEVNIINPTDKTAFVALRTVAFDGSISEFGTSGITLGPHRVFRKSTRELFNTFNFTGGSYFLITSNVALLAMELVEDHAKPSLACLNGININAADRVLNFPHAVLGDDYFSILGVINLLDISQTITISLYQADGTLFNTGSQPNPLTVNLNPKASLRNTILELFDLDPTSVPLTSGWVKAESNFGPITGFVAFGNRSNPTLAAVAPQNHPLTAMVFSHMVPQSLGYFTGVALLNPNAAAAAVQLTVVDRNGITTAVRALTLQPNEKMARLIEELLPEAKDQVGGSLVVESDQPLYGMQLFGTTNFSVLANVPADDITASYTPLEAGKFILSGTLTQPDGTPLASATVRLSGSISTVTTATDEQGVYVFLNVPNGNYAIEPSMKNFNFLPSATSVSINGSSRMDVDFQGKRLPILAITSISPPNGPVGSPVTLHGAGFSTQPGENLVHFTGVLGPATVLRNPPPTEDTITVLVPATAMTGPVGVNVGNNISNLVQFSVTQSDSTAIPIAASVPSSVAYSGLGNLALVGHSERGTISLVALTPNPTVLQNLEISKSARGEIMAVATDDDGTGGGTTRDDDIGFFNIDLMAFKALEAKVASLHEKVSRPVLTGADSLTISDVRLVHLPSGSNPVGLAFEPFGRFAMSANQGTDSVSFVEFPEKAVPFLRGHLSLPAGSKPVSVSVSANARRALVANSGTNSVAVLEFAEIVGGFLNGGLQPVVTRNFTLSSSPASVAINLDASLGVTANADNTASILNLNDPADSSAVRIVALPKFSPGPPTAVNAALAPNGRYAIITSRDSGGNAYLNVLSLDGIPEVTYVQLLPNNTGTSAVAIGPDSSSFLVANPKSGNVALFNSIRGLLSLDTLSLSRARPKESIAIFGTGFSTDPTKNTVRFRSRGDLTITAPILAVPSSRKLIVEVPVDAVSGPVTVNVGNASSNEQFFVVLPEVPPNPPPVITAVVPTAVSRRRNSALSITGSGFNAQSIVEIDLGDGNGLRPLPSVFPNASVFFVDSNQLRVFIPGSQLPDFIDSFNLAVFNPSPGGGRSASVTIGIGEIPDEP